MQERGQTPPEGSRTRDQHRNISITHECSGFDFSDFSGLGVGVAKRTGFQPDGLLLVRGLEDLKRHIIARA
jgi:hypothetical protein